MAFIGPISVSSVENALFSKDRVTLVISKQDVGTGELIITERAFMWRPDSRNDGISIPWTAVSLHAIASEPSRCIYMQLDFRLKWPGVYEGPVAELNGNGRGGSGDDCDEDEGNVSDSSNEVVATELHVIPQDHNDINQMYYAMNHCQEMNPDPNDSISEEENDGEFMDDADASDDDAGHGDMRNLNLNDDPERFADD